ncbi:MAG: hypothetical protein M5U28_44820 [Sandaracinaceae bacterium]|nr:hypothetical protein [Sandaracinaceae bacterium]
MWASRSPRRPSRRSPCSPSGRCTRSSPFGTWGSAANTQLDQLALLQLASVTGIAGVSFLVYWVAASLEALLDRRERPRVRHAAAAVLTVLVVIAGGQARLAVSGARSEDTVRVAAVDTDATLAGLPLPDPEEVRAVDDALFHRSREAARAGARLVVWQEAGTLVMPEGEPAFVERVRELARTERVHVAAAYIVPVALDPLLYENVSLHVTPEGRVAHRYLKHHPVPGEPAVPGRGPSPVVVDEVIGRVSTALCYDYDFPRLGLHHARLNVDLVTLPSSDWRGIDPLHTEMAAVRAIEGGHSIVRATRFGRSAAIDPYGRVRASHDWFDRGTRVMTAELPRRGVTTIYAVVGDAIVAASGAFVLLLVAMARRRRRALAPERRAVT